MVRIGLIGAGDIGTEAYRRVLQLGHSVSFVSARSGIYVTGETAYSGNGSLSSHAKDHWKPEAENKDMTAVAKGTKTDVAFIAIPTYPDEGGDVAYGYMKALLGEGIPVDTAEKGALSKYFPELVEHIDSGRLGYGATVGGGTHMLNEVARRAKAGRIKSIHAVINATQNYMFDRMSHGGDPDEVAGEARDLKIAEPGGKGPRSIIQGESFGDVPKKVTVLYNVFQLATGKRDFIRVDSITPQRLTDELFARLLEECMDRRHVVSVVAGYKAPEEDTIAGFWLSRDEYTIEGGFRLVRRNPLFANVMPSGVNNAILITLEEGGSYVLSGPGAKPVPTVTTMLADLRRQQEIGLVPV